MEDATESILIPRRPAARCPSRDLADPLLGHLGAIADHVAGCLDLRQGDEASGQQPALQQVHQPLGVGEIRLAPGTFLTCPALHTST